MEWAPYQGAWRIKHPCHFFCCPCDADGSGPVFETAVNEYYHTHDPLGYIGMDPTATVAAHNMHVPPSMFGFPQPPPQHCAQVVYVCIDVCT